VLLVGLCATVVWQAGHVIDHSDPLEPADAIFVLGGSRIERALEARDLLLAHVAPRIIISAGGMENAEVALAAQGIHVPSEGEIARDILVGKLDVPAAAVEVLPDLVDNTAQEAAAISRLAAAGGWRRLIVVADCASTRRAGFAMRRELPSTVQIVTRCSRHDSYDPAHWWRTRGDVRQTYFEFPKLIAYWCGLAG
jgi:uncharacterized SAM-binding protein YcdF (DUF218 family)